jgi:2-polyprenyl-3-methyl-5-hydroxy-6-metoxy-1,4-benzoquinol methylase
MVTTVIYYVFKLYIILMTSIYCPICGSSHQKDLYPDTLNGDLPRFDYSFSPEHMRTYKIVKCLSCSHVFSIIPDKNLFENYESVIDLDYLNRTNANILTAKNTIKIINEYISGKTLLDVGCATGDFLSIAKDYYSVEGLELSKWSSDIAQKRGFKVHTCTINNLFPDAKFDIITLWGVIEHFVSPVAELKNISDCLNNDGYVCIYTGNIKSSLAQIMGKHWWYVQGQHIQLFSNMSLRRLFKDAGFEEIIITTYPIVADIKTLSKSLYRYRLLKPIAQIIANNKLIQNKVVTLKLPGEILAIFKKV